MIELPRTAARLQTLIGARPSDARVDDLREALHALPLNQRAALVLREVAGLSYAEIARHLSVSHRSRPSFRRSSRGRLTHSSTVS